MYTLYERLLQLCAQKNIKGARMCTDLGISKSLMTDLKSGRKKGVSAVTAQKIAAYFGVSVAYLLGEEENIEKEPATSGDELSEEEKQFILWYRNQASEKDKAIVRMIVEGDAK